MSARDKYIITLTNNGYEEEELEVLTTPQLRDAYEQDLKGNPAL